LTNILKSIEKLHLAGCKNIAIISNNNIIEPESSIINIHQTSVKICPYSNDEDVSKIIENLLPKNIDGIIGDIKPVELAKKYNIKNSIYI
ncbi:PrpR N-terminal domain-containing protein, partial [Acinetobacter baumannii]